MSAVPGSPVPSGRLRDAATVVVVRDAAHGIEVLLLQRAERGDHNSGAWVFPGGLIDADDRVCHDACVGVDDLQASARLGVAANGLDAYVAAIRECFEEAGLLLMVDAQGRPASEDPDARRAAWRGPMARGERPLADFCREFDLRLAADSLHYIGHWVTPVGRAKRFDTRFFLAVLPPGQASAHDALETTDHVWISPADALAPANTRRLMTPTRAMIELVAAHRDTASLLDWARSPRTVARILPRLATDAAGMRPVQPDEAAWSEIGRLDPDGRGDAWCALRPDVAVRLSPQVMRVCAPGPAGNSYLVWAGDGEGPAGVAVINPASDEPSHLDALIGAAPGPIRWIVIGAGSDRSRVAAALKSRTRATVHGPAGAGVDVVLAGGERLLLADGITLRCLRAGAAAPPNELDLLLVEDGVLFCGAALPPAAAVPAGARWIAPGSGFSVDVDIDPATPR